MLMNTTFLEDSFSIKWQSRGIAQERDFYQRVAGSGRMGDNWGMIKMKR